MIDLKEKAAQEIELLFFILNKGFSFLKNSNKIIKSVQKFLNGFYI